MSDEKDPTDEQQKDAIGGFLTPARHRPDDHTTTASEAHGNRERSDLPGPPGDTNTREQVAHEDAKAGTQAADTDGSDIMTAAEQSGQVSYGSVEPTGEEGAIGAESSSG